MEITVLEKNLNELVSNIKSEDFIYNLMLAYGIPKSTISRIKSGDLNLSKSVDEILYKKSLFFKSVTDQDPHDLIDELINDKTISKHNPRFLIVTDYVTFLSVDTKTKDTLDIPINQINKHYDFFLPWIGKEKTQLRNENIADLKAAVKMSNLFEIILQDNPDLDKTDEGRHSLNIFFARLLFCFFSEDTGIFEDSLFINTLASNTQDTGSDVSTFLEHLFEVLNKQDKKNEPIYLQKFPYVNGGLFSEKNHIPIFSRKSRGIIIEAGQLDWSGINPDIFGSMVQAVASPEERADMGMHYTSVSNILKVINPLFLDDLNESLLNYKTESDLEKLLNRIYNLKIFDPACGSGNFLIVTYKELCLIEIKIYKELQKLNPSKWKIARSGIRLNQFYGITIKDFDVQIAKLSLWISEHQMNLAFGEVFGETKATLPLTESGNIFLGNATRLNWRDLCPSNTKDEIYLIGNPPYSGWKEQTKDQKLDIDFSLKDIKNYRKLDYICCWFKLASDFIKNSNYKYAFVSTASISQGEQVSLIWPYIFNFNQAIEFAYQGFPWTNNASNQAGVLCVIIGISNNSNIKQKKIYSNSFTSNVKNISPYLIEGNLLVSARKKSISNLPPMSVGSQIADGGHLILSTEDKDTLLEKFPKCSRIIKRYLGGEDLIKDLWRWCLWIEDQDLEEFEDIYEIKERIKKCSEFRAASKKEATRKKSSIGHKFFDITYKNSAGIVIPITSSSRRKYMPIGLIHSDTVPSSTMLVIYDAPPYLLCILSSMMAMAWMNIVGSKSAGGSFKYSVTLCYNNFVIKDLDENEKQELNNLAFELINIREKYSEKTLSDLYDPDLMPLDLEQIHEKIDLAIDKLYRSLPFKDNNERLSHLAHLYEKTVSSESLINA